MENRDLFYSLLTLLVWVPLPHGGERFWEIGPVAAISFMLLGIWAFRQWRSSAPLPPVIRNNRLPLTLLVAWLLYVLLQSIPLPFQVLKSLSPHASELKATVDFRDAIPWQSLSIDPGSTLLELIKYIFYITLFFLTLALTNTRKRIRALALTLFAMGFISAIYSLANHYTNGSFSLNDSLPPWINHWSKVTRGTFSHKNHYAAFLELTIPMGIGLLLASLQHKYTRLRVRHASMAMIDFALSIKMFYIVGIALMLISLYLTASRGGNSAFYAALFITSGLFLMRRANYRTTALMLIPLSVILLITFIFLFAGSGNLADRLEKKGFDPNGRDLMRTAIHQIASDFPIFGSGAGTYPYYQYRYKEPALGTTSMSKRAHNDYLETLTDQGPIGLALIGPSLLILLFRIYSGIGQGKSRLRLGMQFSTVLGTTALLIHSIAEFNFRLPAITIYFWVLLAIGMIASSKAVQKIEIG